MNRSVGATIALAATVLCGCAALDTRTPFAHAYDETARPLADVALLTTDFPKFTIQAVDDRKFSHTALKGHPAKVYALPGQRKIVLQRIALAGGLISGSVAAPSLSPNYERVTFVHQVDLKAGKTYYVSAEGVVELPS
jgi:hypothetical protein